MWGVLDFLINPLSQEKLQSIRISNKVCVTNDELLLLACNLPIVFHSLRRT
jgi:predicted ATPase with chaperone activity